MGNAPEVTRCAQIVVHAAIADDDLDAARFLDAHDLRDERACLADQVPPKLHVGSSRRDQRFHLLADLRAHRGQASQRELPIAVVIRNSQTGSENELLERALRTASYRALEQLPHAGEVFLHSMVIEALAARADVKANEIEVGELS